MQAPIPSDEEARLAALDAYGITDTAPDENFDRVVRLACAATATPVGLISLVERDRQWFKARIGMEAAETPREQSFCAHAILEDEVMVVEDATLDPRFADNPLVSCEGGIRFYAGAPLCGTGGQRVGTLCVIDHIPRRIDPRQCALLKDMAGIIVNELELRKMAGTDVLTGAYTRRFLDEMGQRELNRARRMNEPLCVALVDIDKFKSINDTFGHAVGDVVLRMLGQVCQAALRSHDLLGRYGGEEMVAILPRTTLAQAHQVMERVRLAIANMQVPDLEGRRRVTASIGIAQLEERDTNYGTLLSRADEALYRAKDSGRNRIEIQKVA